MRVLLIVPFLALTACDTAATSSTPSAGQDARAAAAAQFPGVNVEAIARCVRDNATADELVLLGQGGAIGTQTTQVILARPTTIQCMRDNDVGLEEV